jgi:hypothetical protein
MTSLGWGRYRNGWRRTFLWIRLPFAVAQTVVARAAFLLGASSVGLIVLLPLAAWWAVPSIIYLMSLRTRIASWVTGGTLLAATAPLLYGEIPLLREWDRINRRTMGFLLFPGGTIVYPFLLDLLVVAVVALELLVLTFSRKREKDAGGSENF